MVVLDNATIWPGDGRSFLGHVVIDGDRIRTVGEGRFGPTGAESDQNMVIEDLGGRVLTPGLIDLMVLGGFDQSILRNDPLDIAREYLRLGVTSCQFCNGTLPWEAQVQVARNVDAARSAQRATQPDALAAARVIGLYLEGPFQHPDFTGASLRENAMLPTPENVDRVLDALGHNDDQCFSWSRRFAGCCREACGSWKDRVDGPFSGNGRRSSGLHRCGHQRAWSRV